MNITTILSNEHRVIEVVLLCLGKVVDEAKRLKKLNKKSAETAIDIIKTFADKCHHGKEENHLFAKMINKGMSSEFGPVGQMLSEHRQGREYVRGMSENLDSASNGDMEAINLFAENALGYVQLLQAHIHKEDTILFPMADKMLNEEEQKNLLNEFHHVESDHMGDGTHEAYLDKVKKLAEQYHVEFSLAIPTSCGCNH